MSFVSPRTASCPLPRETTTRSLDGWEHDGKLYIRVIDYKTGKKKMELSDILYGVGLQMFIYLFALEREGGGRYGGREIVPAGVLYSPAREALVRSRADLPEPELAVEREKLRQFSGLVLMDDEVLEAMEKGGPRRLPLKISSKTGELSGALASAGQLGKLGRAVDALVADMADEVRRGSITADPYMRNAAETACAYCKYFDACRFADGEAGESYRRFYKLKNTEFWDLLDREQANRPPEGGKQEEGGGV